MSLVSDALRKARQEAAGKRAQQRGVIYTGTIVTQGGTRTGLGLVIGSIIAVLAGIGGGAAVWWTISRTSPSAPSEVVTAGPTPIPDTAVVASELIRQSGGTAAEPGDPETTQKAPEAPVSSPDPEPEVKVSEATPVPVQPTPEPQPEVLPATTEDERVFVLEADLGYATLSLGFLVFRSNDPFAEINGLEVREGESIDGFVVEKIERTQVTLRDAQGPLVLKVK